MSDFETVWARLRSSNVSKQLISSFQEFVQEEEFEFSTFTEDLEDREDESTIAEWFKNNGHDIQEFRTVKQLILVPINDESKSQSPALTQSQSQSQSYNASTSSSSSLSSAQPNNFQKSKTMNTLQFNQKQTDAQAQPPPGLLKQQSQMHAQQILKQLNLSNNNDPQMIQDIILQLQRIGNPNQQTTTAGADTGTGAMGAMGSHHTLGAIHEDNLVGDNHAHSTNNALQPSSASTSAMMMNDDVSPPGMHNRQGSISDLMNHMQSYQYTADELNEFANFCNEEEYDPANIAEDVDTFEDGDSFIALHMQDNCNWNDRRCGEFIQHLRHALELRKNAKLYLAQNNNNNHNNNHNHSHTDINNNNNNNNNNSISVNAHDSNALLNVQSQSSASQLHWTQSGRNLNPEGINVRSDEKSNPIHQSVTTTNNSVAQLISRENIALPVITDFSIPKWILEQRQERSMTDIFQCFESNSIDTGLIDILKQFCIQEQCDFDFSSQDSAKFVAKFENLSIFTEYIKKCKFELRVPQFMACHLSSKDLQKKGSYFERHCPGAIRHDKDLLRYFTITSATDSDLSVILPDIVDRLSVETNYQLDLGKFSKLAFFKNLNSKQSAYIKNGLRTYHNRFFPRLTLTPLSLIADRISDYQKYVVFFSDVLEEYLNTYETVPFMIDVMIIPPGIYHRSQSANTAYNASQTLAIGDIPTILRESNIHCTPMQGMKTDSKNTTKLFKNLKKELLTVLNQMIVTHDSVHNENSTAKTTHPRICIVIDRRWRINSTEYQIFNRLRCRYSGESLQSANKKAVDTNVAYESEGNRNADSAGFMSVDNRIADGDGDDDDDSDEDGNNNNNKSTDWETTGISNMPSVAHIMRTEKFCLAKQDSLYIYQPSCGQFKTIQFDQYSSDYCEESLMYLTKNCIIPRTHSGYVSESNNNSHSKQNESKSDDFGGGGFNSKFHIGGDVPDGYLFNLSIHVHKATQNWYKHKMRWYTFMQSASVRFFEADLVQFWPRYFVDGESDVDLLTMDEVRNQFKFDLKECDTAFKRWFYAIKRLG